VGSAAVEVYLAWFEKNLITTWPYQHRGGGRRVYPGFTQPTAFASCACCER
jgi:poly-beta-hydroxyalkanoate depolymerase